MARHKGDSGICRICKIFANLTLKLQWGEGGVSDEASCLLKATEWDLDVWFSLKLMEIGCPDLQAAFKSFVSIYN